MGPKTGVRLYALGENPVLPADGVKSVSNTLLRSSDDQQTRSIGSSHCCCRSSLQSTMASKKGQEDRWRRRGREEEEWKGGRTRGVKKRDGKDPYYFRNIREQPPTAARVNDKTRRANFPPFLLPFAIRTANTLLSILILM